MYPKVFVCLALLICLSQAFEDNYCDPTLCEDGLTHTACDHYLVKRNLRKFLFAGANKEYFDNRSSLKIAAKNLKLFQ